MKRADLLPAGAGVSIHEIGWFKPDPTNPRKWSAEDVQQFASAIARYGFRVPILCYSDGRIVDGHFRLAAATALGLKELPCMASDDWDPKLVAEFRLSVNRMGELAAWESSKLLERLEALRASDAPLGDDGPIGFGLEEVDDSAEIEAWDFAPTEDVHVVTIRSPLPIAAEVRERLRGLAGVEIVEDNLELP